MPERASESVNLPTKHHGQAPVPLHPILEAFLRAWQKESTYSEAGRLGFCEHSAKGKATQSCEHAGRGSPSSSSHESGDCSQATAEVWLPQLAPLVCHILSQFGH